MSSPVTMNVNTNTSSTGLSFRVSPTISQYVQVSPATDPRTPYKSSIIPTPIFIVIQGSLSEGRSLKHPVIVQIEDDDDEILVSEPHFHIHASGTTLSEAIDAFKHVFSGYLDILSEDEATLGTYLQKQLDYLRSMIRTN